MKVKSLVILARPQQYVKNTFIFLPIFFGLQISNVPFLLNALMAFIAFSFTASSLYILNDYLDREEDRKHPIKKSRPIASGDVSAKSALIFMLVLFVLGMSLMVSLSLYAALILASYAVMIIAYSFYFKHIAIIDVSIIAVGFVLRLFIGSAVTGIELSIWIVVMTYLLALFLALAKRRDDVLIFQETGEKMRKNVDGYNLRFLDGVMTIMAAVVIVAYILYTTSTEVVHRFGSEYLYLTAFFVVIGIMRYMQIAYVEKDSGSPTKVLLKDRFIQLAVIGWIATFSWILYL
jgi:4-hydroxybenzoate polyprenyltransferase